MHPPFTYICIDLNLILNLHLDIYSVFGIVVLWCIAVTRMSVTTRSRSEAGIGSEFRSEQSYQVLEEGNRIGLGFNLCVVPTHTICGYVL